MCEALRVPRSNERGGFPYSAPGYPSINENPDKAIGFSALSYFDDIILTSTMLFIDQSPLLALRKNRRKTPEAKPAETETNLSPEKVLQGELDRHLFNKVTQESSNLINEITVCLESGKTFLDDLTGALNQSGLSEFAGHFSYLTYENILVLRFQKIIHKALHDYRLRTEQAPETSSHWLLDLLNFRNKLNECAKLTHKYTVEKTNQPSSSEDNNNILSIITSSAQATIAELSSIRSWFNNESVNHMEELKCLLEADKLGQAYSRWVDRQPDKLTVPELVKIYELVSRLTRATESAKRVQAYLIDSNIKDLIGKQTEAYGGKEAFRRCLMLYTWLYEECGYRMLLNNEMRRTIDINNLNLNTLFGKSDAFFELASKTYAALNHVLRFSDTYGPPPGAVLTHHEKELVTLFLSESLYISSNSVIVKILKVPDTSFKKAAREQVLALSLLIVLRNEARYRDNFARSMNIQLNHALADVFYWDRAIEEFQHIFPETFSQVNREQVATLFINQFEPGGDEEPEITIPNTFETHSHSSGLPNNPEVNPEREQMLSDAGRNSEIDLAVEEFAPEDLTEVLAANFPANAEAKVKQVTTQVEIKRTPDTIDDFLNQLLTNNKEKANLQFHLSVESPKLGDKDRAFQAAFHTFRSTKELLDYLGQTPDIVIRDFDCTWQHDDSALSLQRYLRDRTSYERRGYSPDFAKLTFALLSQVFKQTLNDFLTEKLLFLQNKDLLTQSEDNDQPTSNLQPDPTTSSVRITLPVDGILPDSAAKKTLNVTLDQSERESSAPNNDPYLGENNRVKYRKRYEQLTHLQSETDSETITKNFINLAYNTYLRLEYQFNSFDPAIQMKQNNYQPDAKTFDKIKTDITRFLQQDKALTIEAADSLHEALLKLAVGIVQANVSRRNLDAAQELRRPETYKFWVNFIQVNIARIYGNAEYEQWFV